MAQQLSARSEVKAKAPDRTIGVAFSLNPDHYQPRCVSCHKLFDLGRTNARR